MATASHKVPVIFCGSPNQIDLQEYLLNAVSDASPEHRGLKSWKPDRSFYKALDARDFPDKLAALPEC